MEGEHEIAHRAAKRAYELGRLRTAVLRATAVAVLVAGAAAIAVGARALVWLPLTWLGWVLVEWRGTWLLRGARRGLLAGVAALFLPLSILRPCCGTGAVECCSGAMPPLCAAVGGLLGLSLALLIPRAPGARRVEAALGVAIGAASVAALRCGPLLIGEAAGLLGGLTAGVLAASLARAVVDRRHA
jgi:hypothetical protein